MNGENKHSGSPAYGKLVTVFLGRGHNQTAQAMAKRASSILMQHYHGQMNNPIIMARMLLLEGVFDEQYCYEVTCETSISSQNDAFNKALEKTVDDYDKLIIFAVILLKYKTTVHIGKILLKECGKIYSLILY